MPALNDSESVDFEPGDVIWMPLYADDQYVWTNTWTEGSDAEDAVSSIRLDDSYFTAGTEGKDPSSGTVSNVSETFEVRVELVNEAGNTWADGDQVDAYVGATKVQNRAILRNVSGSEAVIDITFDEAEYETAFDVSVDNFTGKTFSVKVNKDAPVSVSTVIGTTRTNGSNAVSEVAAQLNTVPTTVDVVDGDGVSVERTVSSAKAVVNGKTFTVNDVTDAAKVAQFVADVNSELTKMAAAGKSAQIKDVTVTVNLAKKAAVDDVVNKPHIEVADNDKVMVDYGHYTGNIDKNWSINLIEKSTGVAELIEKAELYKATATDYASYSKYTDEIMPNAVYLKITLEDTWKTVDSETLTYYVYVADNDSGIMGFIKSIKRFDTSFEVKLSTYAVPYMIGEIKRYIRDDGPIKVSRSIKELGFKIKELQRENLNKKRKRNNNR